MSETTASRCLEAWSACVAALIEVGRLPDPVKKAPAARKAPPKAAPKAKPPATAETTPTAETVETTIAPSTSPPRGHVEIGGAPLRCRIAPRHPSARYARVFYRGKKPLPSPRVYSSLVVTTTGVSAVTTHGHSLGASLLMLSVLSGAAGCAAPSPMASPSLQELIEAKAGRTQTPPSAGNDGNILQPPPVEALPAEALPMASVCVRIKDQSSCSIDPAHAIPVGAQCLCPGRYRVGTAK